MRMNRRVVAAIAALALPILACQTLMGGGGNGGGGNTPSSTPASKVIFSDDFSSKSWGTGTDKDSSIEYQNNALHMIVYKKNWFVWSTPNDQTYQNVHIETTVTSNDTDATTAVGIMCDRQSNGTDFYYAALTPAGEYAIAKSAEGQGDKFLTNDDKWGTSDAIAKEASSYRIGMDCGNGTLTLYVDGKQVDSVSDASYTGGGVALLTWSGENATKTDVSFDDFQITKLP